MPPFPFDRQRANAPSWKATTIFSHQGGPEPPWPPNGPEAEGGRVRNGHPLLLLLDDGLALEWGKGTNCNVGMQIPNTFLVANHVLAHDDKSSLSADQQSPSSYHTENKK